MPTDIGSDIYAGVKVMGFHPFADKFPMMGDAELAELALDVAENGLHNPITLTSERLILDGRGRYRACQIASVAPTFVTYEGDDPAGFVISQNVNRRHMSTGARAMAAALVLQVAGHRRNERWKYGRVDFADLQNVSSSGWRSRLSQCGVILDHAPWLADYVVKEQLSLDAAFHHADAVRRAQRFKPDNGEAEARYQGAFAAMAAHDKKVDALKEEGRPVEDALEKASAALTRDERKQRLWEWNKPPTPYDYLARAVSIVANHGRSDSMAGFDLADLDPALARCFAKDELNHALRGVEMLIEWRP